MSKIHQSIEFAASWLTWFQAFLDILFRNNHLSSTTRFRKRKSFYELVIFLTDLDINNKITISRGKRILRKVGSWERSCFKIAKYF